MRENIYFVIPIYNESKNLPYLFESIKRVGRYLDVTPFIIAIDDGSTDESLTVLNQYKKELEIHVICHEKNLGPGAAFKSGFKYIVDNISDLDIVVTVEADNTSDLCVIGKMLELLNRGYEIVLANVYGLGKIVGATVLRRFISFWANVLMKLVLRIHGVDTYTSFFRVYRGVALKRLFSAYGENTITEKGFTCMLEILIKFNLLGLHIGQVPMILDSKIRIGESKMKIIRNTRSTLLVLYNYLFSRKYRLGKQN